MTCRRNGRDRERRRYRRGMRHWHRRGERRAHGNRAHRTSSEGEVEGGDEETVESRVGVRVTAGSGIEQVETMETTVVGELNGIAFDSMYTLEDKGVTLDVQALSIGHGGSVLLDNGESVELVIREVRVKTILATLGGLANNNAETGGFAFLLGIQGAAKFADGDVEFDENVMIGSNIDYACTGFDDASDDLL